MLYVYLPNYTWISNVYTKHQCTIQPPLPTNDLSELVEHLYGAQLHAMHYDHSIRYMITEYVHMIVYCVMFVMVLLYLAIQQDTCIYHDCHCTSLSLYQRNTTTHSCVIQKVK